MKHRFKAFGAIAAASLLVLSACGDDSSSSDATTATTAASPATVTDESITVGSGNFPEAVVLGEIYAGALEAKGVKVERKLNIGARELYYKAITDGEIDLLPEYTNSLLSYVDKQKGITPKATNVDEQVAALKTDLDPTLTVLTPSAAEDKDVIVCNSETASKYSLKTLDDLAKVSKELKVAAPPEFETRDPFGIPGLKRIYGIEFASFTPLKIGTPMYDALKSNAVQCANLFSTDPTINTNGFVALEDNKVAVPNEAVLPLIVKDKASDTVTSTLNAVNAKLTTEGLTALLVKIVNEKQAEGAVATQWLKDNGFTS